MTDDTLHLAQLAANGNAEALEHLLERHLPSVRAFVRAHMSPKLRARESASDVVQSVCRELLANQGRFEHPGEHGFEAWLFTTARRKVANRARDLGRGKRDADREVGNLSENAIASLGAAYARISSPSHRVLQKEEIERLEAAIDALPDEQREAMTLAHLAGLSRAAIGIHMGRTEEAVRSLLHRAKARLAMLLGVAADG